MKHMVCERAEEEARRIAVLTQLETTYLPSMSGEVGLLCTLPFCQL